MFRDHSVILGKQGALLTLVHFYEWQQLSLGDVGIDSH